MTGAAFDRDQLLTRAVALHRLGRLDDAERAYSEVLRALPGDPDALHLTGVTALQRGDYVRAIELISRAVLRSARPEMLCNLGAACRGAGRLGDAINHYEAALAKDPRSVQALNNLGNVCRELGDSEGAVTRFRAALAIAPDDDEIQSNLLYALSFAGTRSPEDVARHHREWGARRSRPRTDHTNDRDPERKLRVGLVSADLRTHSVSFFLTPYFEARDRSAISLVAYSTGARVDATTARLRALADQWVEIHGHSDDAVAARVVADRIDVLVDLGGHTGGNRLGVFARAPAPVQISWLGYPGTTGLTTMTARLVDDVTDPAGADESSSEPLVRLPGGFLCYEPWAAAPEVSVRPRSHNIAFGSFNNLAKVDQPVIELWARVLRACEGSVLVLKASPLGDPGVRRLIEARFERAGIAARRLRLLREEPTVEGHLARYAEVDIALDPFPYNGTTTTCEALWMGVPVVTLEGDRHAARVGTSLLSRVGLSDLVARDSDDYVAIAARLAADPPALAALRGTLRSRVAASSLGDRDGFARSFEGALRTLWRAFCAGNGPT